MMLDTCKYLIKVDEDKFKQIIRKPRLNGRKSVYFSTDKNNCQYTSSLMDLKRKKWYNDKNYMIGEEQC